MSASVYHHRGLVCSSRILQDVPNEMRLFSRRVELDQNLTDNFLSSSCDCLRCQVKARS